MTKAEAVAEDTAEEVEQEPQGITRADLATMTPAQILRADAAGELNALKGIPEPHKPSKNLTRDDITKLAAEGRHAEIAAASDEGRINYNEGA